MREVTTREMRFINEYLVTGNGALAARTAGYSREYARKVSGDLLRRPHIKEAIDQARAKLREDQQYDLEKAVREIDAKIAGAEKANQWTAVANMMQVKMKLHGLLIEKVQQLTMKVDLKEALDAAHARVLRRELHDNLFIGPKDA